MGSAVISGNTVSVAGNVVTKRYRGNREAYYRELLTFERLSRVQPRLPLPQVLDGCQPGELRTARVEGVSGAEAVSAGRASQMLEAIGSFLRRLHDLDPQLLADIAPGCGDVIVHGDLAHYNCLISQEGAELAAVLDWECVHLGNRLEDLAWCEFQFINRFPEHAYATNSLYEGYGRTFDWELRHSAYEERIKQLTAGAQVEQAQSTETRHYARLRFGTPQEAAAFVAAFSRFLSGPAGERYSHMPVQLLCKDGPELWLSEDGVTAAADAFGHIRVSSVMRLRDLPQRTRILIESGRVAAWGLAEAERNLNFDVAAAN